MTEADVLRSAQEAATWWYFNQPQMDETALAQCAKDYAAMAMYGDADTTSPSRMQEFYDVPGTSYHLSQDAFIAEYRRLQAGHMHGPELLTDLREIRRTFDALPAITAAMTPCPNCFTPLIWLAGAQMWRCDGCKVMLTPDAVKQHEGHT
jgi:ribosomal protein L37AE/L43A